MQKDVVFLSDRLARKMFDQENPIGKVISYNKEIELTVKGTYADIPENATVRPDAVISLPTVWSRGWGNYSWREAIAGSHLSVFVPEQTNPW